MNKTPLTDEEEADRLAGDHYEREEIGLNDCICGEPWICPEWIKAFCHEMTPWQREVLEQVLDPAVDHLVLNMPHLRLSPSVTANRSVMTPQNGVHPSCNWSSKAPSDTGVTDD